MNRIHNWLSFRRQWWLSFAIALCGFALAHWTKYAFLSNAAWVLVGLLFLIHPVVPESAKWRYGTDEARMRRDGRIAGGVILLLSLIVKFGV